MEPTETLPVASPDLHKLRKLTLGMFRMLGLQFVLGVAMATIADIGDDPTHPPLLHVIFLILHVLLAFGLLVNAIMIFVKVQGWKQKPWNVVGIGGLAGIIVALAAGVLTITSPWHELFAFIMGLGFIEALGMYVTGLISLPPEQK